jgi:hypothetical protein
LDFGLSNRGVSAPHFPLPFEFWILDFGLRSPRSANSVLPAALCLLLAAHWLDSEDAGQEPEADRQSLQQYPIT